MPSVLVDHVQHVAFGSFGNLHAPTSTFPRSLQIAASNCASTDDNLRRLVEEDLAALEEKVKSADAPWTLIQAMPDWPPR